MKLFSKRSLRTRYRDEDSFRGGLRLSRFNAELISPEIRNRLISEIGFLASCDDFLEWFILFDNQPLNKIYFDKYKIDSFSLSELGYKMSDYFVFEKMQFVEQERERRISINEGVTEKFFDDAKLFDLVEIVILFAKENKRKEVIDRFNSIFSEENASYQIIEYLITRRSGENLRTLVSLLKDENLSDKITSYYYFEEKQDLLSMAKLATEILNIIFSGYIKDHKAKEINELEEKLVAKLVKNSPQKAIESKKLIAYFDELLKISKKFSNDIYDIRHTEKSTIKVTNDYTYKLISELNMSMSEIVITTLKDDYVFGENWEDIKNAYIEKYKINKNTRLTIKKSEADDIPF